MYCCSQEEWHIFPRNEKVLTIGLRHFLFLFHTFATSAVFVFLVFCFIARPLVLNMGSVEPPVAGSGLARCGGKDMEPKMWQNTNRHMLQVSFSGCACTQPHLQAYVATTIATRANTMQLYPIFLLVLPLTEFSQQQQQQQEHQQQQQQ